MDFFYTEFYPDRTKNVGHTETNLLTPLIKEWLSLNPFKKLNWLEK